MKFSKSFEDKHKDKIEWKSLEEYHWKNLKRPSKLKIKFQSTNLVKNWIKQLFYLLEVTKTARKSFKRIGRKIESNESTFSSQNVRTQKVENGFGNQMGIKYDKIEDIFIWYFR